MAVYPVTDYVTCSRLSTGYGRDSSGTWQSYANNTLRYDYNDGVRRLLVEEARTNSIRNNSMQGIVAGSAGTLPNNWQAITTGLTRTIGASSVVNGVEQAEFRVSGTTSGTATQWKMDGVSVIAATVGQTWTISAFLTLSSGDLTNISSVQLCFFEFDSGGSYLANHVSNVSITSSQARYSATITTTDASCAFIQPMLLVNHAIGVAIDIGVTIGWPQLEQGAFATSPIPTTSAAATRQPDVVSMTLPTTLQSLSAYTLYGKAMPQAPTTSAANQNVLQIDASSATNRHLLRRSTTGTLLVATVSTAGGGAGANMVPAGTWAQDASKKWAAALANNDGASVFDNGTAVTDNTIDMPTSIATMRVGCNQSGTESFNGGIEQVGLWGSRRNNSALGTLTT